MAVIKDKIIRKILKATARRQHKLLQTHLGQQQKKKCQTHFFRFSPFSSLLLCKTEIMTNTETYQNMSSVASSQKHSAFNLFQFHTINVQNIQG